MIKKYQVALLTIIFGAVCVIGGMCYIKYTQEPPKPISYPIYIEVPVEVIKEVEIPVEIIKTITVPTKTRDFKSVNEFLTIISKYINGVTFTHGTCIEHSRDMVDILKSEGYYVDTEIINNNTHMVIKGFIQDKQIIVFYDLETGRFWDIEK